VKTVFLGGEHSIFVYITRRNRAKSSCVMGSPIKNIRKIMNHHDVLVSKGKEPLTKIHANALARRGLEHKSIAHIQESFDLFFNLLDFQLVSLDLLDQNLQVCRPHLSHAVCQRRESGGSPRPRCIRLLV
jgi:hypothetical protein